MNETAKADPVRALLPCPFCGGAAERIDFGPGDAENEGGSCIACTRCQSSGPVEFGFKENFIANWNRRAALAQQAGAGDQNPVAFQYRSRQWSGDEFTGDWHSPNMPRSFYNARPGAYETRDLYTTPQPAIPEGMKEAAEFAADVLAELYCKYQLKIGPYASQAQFANTRLRQALAQHNREGA